MVIRDGGADCKFFGHNTGGRGYCLNGPLGSAGNLSGMGGGMYIQNHISGITVSNDDVVYHAPQWNGINRLKFKNRFTGDDDYYKRVWSLHSISHITFWYHLGVKDEVNPAHVGKLAVVNEEGEEVWTNSQPMLRFDIFFRGDLLEEFQPKELLTRIEAGVRSKLSRMGFGNSSLVHLVFWKFGHSSIG